MKNLRHLRQQETQQEKKEAIKEGKAGKMQWPEKPSLSLIKLGQNIKGSPYGRKKRKKSVT